jgi:hypothetical protein
MGCSAHHVPSLSDVTNHFVGGKNPGPSIVTRLTKARIGLLAVPSLQLGRGYPGHRPLLRRFQFCAERTVRCVTHRG